MAYNYENIPGLNPFVGAVITFVTFLFGLHLPALNIILHYHIPPGVIEAFQVFAYSGTGIVGMVTGYKFYKESIKPKFKKKGKK